LRANSHRWRRVVDKMNDEARKGLRVVNAEGDALEFCSATYRVLDEAGLIAGLMEGDGFEEDTPKDGTEGGRSFAWLESGDADARRSYGHIQIRGGRLRLECNSRKRLELGRRLLEENAATCVEHLGDSFESLEAVKRRLAREGPPAPAKTIPPEVERDLIQKLQAEHYAKWPDTALPALSGKTPREAVKTAAGREAVEDLIRMMENGEERERKAGRGWFEFSGVRQELGLGG
jgi:hypothetical protein